MKRIAGTGTVLRLLTVVFALALALAGTTAATAATTAPSARWFQGATWEEQSQRDDEDEETPESEEEDDKSIPDEDEEETPEDEETPADDEETPEDEDEDAGSGDDELNPDWVDGGLISETEYESPQFGYTVEWDDPWTVDDWYDDPDNGENATGAVATDVDGYDNLHIWDADLDAILWIQGFENTNALTAAEIEEFWTDEDNVAEFGSGDGEVAATDSDDERAAVLMIYTDDDDNVWVRYDEAIMLDDGDSVVTLGFIAPAEAALEAYQSAQEVVTVNGDETFSMLRDRDVETALEDLG